MPTAAAWEIRDDAGHEAVFDGRTTYAEALLDAALRGARGALAVSFTAEGPIADATLIVLTGGGPVRLSLRLRADGSVVVRHRDGAARVEIEGPAGTVKPGVPAIATYAWDARGGCSLTIAAGHAARMVACFASPAGASLAASPKGAMLRFGASVAGTGPASVFRGRIRRIEAHDSLPRRADLTEADLLDLVVRDGFRVRQCGAGREPALVELLDPSGKVSGMLRQSDLEETVPCFVPGTMIATPDGERPVETLKAGDRVLTRDNGVQEIAWAGARAIDWDVLRQNRHLQPILIRKGALGPGLPARDMQLSPNHRVLLANDRTRALFGEREVFAAARDLVGRQGVHAIQAIGATYVHVMFARHEVVLANGAWAESFQPTAYSLRGVGRGERERIAGLFPELATAEGLDAYRPARRSLSRSEAEVLVGNGAGVHKFP